MIIYQLSIMGQSLYNFCLILLTMDRYALVTDDEIKVICQRLYSSCMAP